MLDWEAKCVSGNRKEGDLMQLYKDCIHVVCKDISCIHLVNKLMTQGNRLSKHHVSIVKLIISRLNWQLIMLPYILTT